MIVEQDMLKNFINPPLSKSRKFELLSQGVRHTRVVLVYAYFRVKCINYKLLFFYRYSKKMNIFIKITEIHIFLRYLFKKFKEMFIKVQTDKKIARVRKMKVILGNT